MLYFKLQNLIHESENVSQRSRSTIEKSLENCEKFSSQRVGGVGMTDEFSANVSSSRCFVSENKENDLSPDVYKGFL